MSVNDSTAVKHQVPKNVGCAQLAEEWLCSAALVSADKAKLLGA